MCDVIYKFLRQDDKTLILEKDLLLTHNRRTLPHAEKT